MKSLAESPAVLTVHQSAPGHYILRVADLDHRPLVIGVSKLLEDATSLVVITPTDTKVFLVNSNGAIPQPVDAETQAVIDQEESRPIPNSTVDDIAGAIGAEVIGETAQGTKVIRRKKNPTPVAGHDEPCGRCSGEGKIQVLLDGGSPAETSCPICKGSGVMRRYGARR
jgi:hypothetical protein